MVNSELPRCRCGATGVDASGRCFECVNIDYNRVVIQGRDKRSLYKLREIDELVTEQTSPEENRK